MLRRRPHEERVARDLFWIGMGVSLRRNGGITDFLFNLREHRVPIGLRNFLGSNQILFESRHRIARGFPFAFLFRFVFLRVNKCVTEQTHHAQTQ